MHIAKTCGVVAALLAARFCIAADYKVGDKVVVIEDGKLTVSGNQAVDNV